MDELLQEFIAETRETLEAIAGEIVAWEANPGDRARLDAIFRFVHTVKGSCGFLDLPRLSRLSHAAEDVLAAVRAGERIPDTALVNAVLAIVDRIGELVEAIDAGAALDDSSEELLIAALAADAAAPEPATLAPAGAVLRAPVRSVRLSVDLLDRMMSGMSDMVLARNELARRLRDDPNPVADAALERLTLTVAEMRDTVTRTRMQRVETLFSALPRLVRDTAATAGKTVNLVVDGGDVELDREMIEMMRDPLVHMIRNAIDHGIEGASQRKAAGKPSAGQLTVTARQSGNRIIIEVADDGRGIDSDRLVAKLVAADPARDAELRALGEDARLDLIFEPGASTAETISTLSGRGVGMDVVRANIEQIGGRICLANRPGQGLTVTIEVPLTLAIISAVVVAVGEHRFALPRRAIDEILAASAASLQIDAIGDAPTVTVREQRLPLADLGRGVGLSASTAHTIVILAVPGGRYALAVDRVVDTEELVVKPLAPVVMAAGVYAGQTLPDNGRPMLLIDCSGVAAACDIRFDSAPKIEPLAAEPVASGEPALLFEDFDGARRAIHLAAIDRVEQVAIEDIVMLGGRRQVLLDGRPLPLAITAALPASGTLSVLRLNDGVNELGYAVADPLDIVTLAGGLVPAVPGGPILGVAMVDGYPIETVDTLWLFAEAASGPRVSAALCLLQGRETGWMETFLRPALEAAGYRVATTLAPGQHAQIALAMEDDALVADAAAPVVRLSRAPGQGIYRYDRGALIAAIAAGVAGAAA